MMKKIVSMLLVLSLLMCTAAACAEGVTTITYTTPTYDGGWYSFYNAFYICLPNAWQSVEVTDEDYDNGIRFMAASDDESQMFFLLCTSAEELDGIADVTVMAEVLKENGVDAQLASVNGIPTVLYTDADDIAYLQFFTEQGDAYSFAFYPASDENMQALISAVGSTLTADVSALSDVEIVNVEKALKLSFSDALITILQYFNIIEKPPVD